MPYACILQAPGCMYEGQGDLTEGKLELEQARISFRRAEGNRHLYSSVTLAALMTAV